MFEPIPYYRAALRVLRYLEERRPTGRRFGKEADARWAALRGDLAMADRVDILIRDANAEWPGALGARAVFRMNDVAEDDPFGARWVPLDPVDGEEIWRAVLDEKTPSSLHAALSAVASAWDVKLAKFSAGAIATGDRLLVAGASAIASVVEAFADNTDLDWRRQVVVVATKPPERQLAALAPAWLNFNEAIHVLGADEEPAEKLGKRKLIISDDAGEDDRRWAETLSKKG